MGQTLLKKSATTVSETKASVDSQPRMVSGIRNSRKRKQKKTKATHNTVTLAARRKQQSDVTVYDYTEKRESIKLATRNKEVSKVEEFSVPNTVSVLVSLFFPLLGINLII